MGDSPEDEKISQTSTSPSAMTFRAALQSSNVPGLPNEQLRCKVAVVVADLVGVQLVELRKMLMALLTGKVLLRSLPVQAHMADPLNLVVRDPWRLVQHFWALEMLQEEILLMTMMVMLESLEDLLVNLESLMDLDLEVAGVGTPSRT